MNINQMFKTTQRFMKRSVLALAAVAATGMVAGNAQAVSFTETNLSSSSDATGAEIANDGTLVRAYHFGGSAITDITVHGVIFTSGGGGSSGTDSAMTGLWDDGWGPGWELTAPTDVDYKQLISSMTAARHATGTAVSTITIGGLTVGHEYRLQLISNKPREGVVDVEGTTGAFTVGDTTAATMLTATWVAADDTLNAGFVNQNHPDGPHFCGYALHDITPVTADAGTSTVTASPTTVANDGITLSTVTVTLKDAGSAPASGKTVTLASSRTSTDTISDASGVSSGSGVVTFTVKSSTAGAAVFTATDVTDSVTVTQTATVTFVSDAVSVANSTVSASPTSVAADGSTTSTITVTVKNGDNNPLSGKDVTLAKTSGPGSPVIAPSVAMTDGSGVATFTVKSTTAGVDVFTATETNDLVVIVQTATVTFTAGAVSAGTSTVVASPAIVPADGTAASTITVTLLDANNNPVTNKTVSLASSRGVTDTISEASGPSSASGVVTFSVTSLTAGGSVFTATGDSVELSTKPEVTFGASAAASTVVADPTSVLADGTTTSTITVTLKDGSNNAVTNKTVTLVSSRGATDTISVASGASDASGVVTFTVTSTTAGVPVFTATDITDGVMVTQTATVTFTVGAVSAAQSTVVASPTSVMANGTDTSTITVTLKDAYNNPVAGKTVSLAHTSGPGTPVITPVSGTTSASGVATFTVKSTTVGADVFTATDDTDSLPITQTATVTFTLVPATIAWGSATDDTLNAGNTAFLETDVKTNGKFVAAVCNGGAGTVNGVTFTGWTSYNTAGTYLITYGASPVTMQWAGNRGDVNWGSPSAAFGTFGYEGGNNKLLLTGGGEGLSPNTITLSSLVADNTYQVQIWAPTWNNTFNISVGGVTLRVGNPPGTLSQYVVGTFTANGTSQTISCSGVAPSAISVRDVSLPKGTLIMAY